MGTEILSANAPGENYISPDDFASLLKRAADNDTAAQAQLCQHYETKVRIVARVLLGPALRSHFDCGARVLCGAYGWSHVDMGRPLWTLEHGDELGTQYGSRQQRDHCTSLRRNGGEWIYRRPRSRLAVHPK